MFLLELNIVDHSVRLVEFEVLRSNILETSNYLTAQVLMPLLKSDLFEVLQNTLQGKLASNTPEWKERSAAVTVVMASGGYPGEYTKGAEITGNSRPPGGTGDNNHISRNGNQVSVWSPCPKVFHRYLSSYGRGVFVGGRRSLTIVIFGSLLVG